ncbi:MAG: hypothetical protein LBK08_01725 [Treponema sp.]|nr:hypothetical protein [Treponema sp.]
MTVRTLVKGYNSTGKPAELYLGSFTAGRVAWGGACFGGYGGSCGKREGPKSRKTPGRSWAWLVMD